MGRRVRLFPPIVLALFVVSFGLSRAGVAHAARTMAFGGGTDQNLFQLQLRYCEDGMQIAVQQQAPISTDAAELGVDNAHFSLQLMTATPTVNQALPFPIVVGDGTSLVNGFAQFYFTTVQAPGTPVQVSIGRWDHSTTPADTDPDNVQTDSGGVVEACTILPTATPTVTATFTPTSTPTALPTATSTTASTSTPTLIPSPTAPPTMIPSPTATRTAVPTHTAAATPVSGGVTMSFAPTQSPHLVAFQTSANLGKGSGSGNFTETLKLFVPGGAFNTNLSLHLGTPSLGNLSSSLRAGTGSSGKVGFGFVFALSASDTNGNAVARFSGARPALIQLLYDPAGLQGTDPTTLRVSTLDPTGTTWQDLPTTVDTFHHMLTARATRLTLFQARGDRPAKGGPAGTTFAGPVHITMPAVSRASLGGMPLDLALPQDSLQAPVSLIVTGAPGARLSAGFTRAGVTITQTLTLDTQGYAATYFTPPTPPKSPQRLQMSVKVSLGGASYATTGTVMLAVGQGEGPLPPGAPPLWATLSASSVKAQAAPPLLTVRTAPGMTVHAVLEQAGKPVAGLPAETGDADHQGLLQLPLPFIPRTLPAVQSLGKGKTLALQVVVTVSLHGAADTQVLALTVRP